MKTEAVRQVRGDSLFADISILVKARLSLLVLITTLVGFLAGWRGPFDYLLLVATLAGTALSACGAAALNQWWERALDGRMRRTATRPLPAGRMHPNDALMLGLLFSLSGVVCLFLFVNTLTAALSLATILLYILVYTPLKRVTTLNTLIGAVPGALPPLIGWTAATGAIGLEGMILFAILWFWQMPHFLAISWMYRDEYRGAGFVMLSGSDPSGALTARQSVVYTVYLTGVSLLPAALPQVALWYGAAALALGLGFLALAIQFLRTRTTSAARHLFFASIVYLPLLLAVFLAARH